MADTIQINEQNTYHSGAYERAPLSLWRKTMRMHRARRKGRLIPFQRPPAAMEDDPKARRENALRIAQRAREEAEQLRRAPVVGGGGERT